MSECDDGKIRLTQPRSLVTDREGRRAHLRRYREVRLVAAGNRAEAARASRRIAQLHAHSQELIAHVAMAEVIGERPCWLARLGDRAAVQRVPLGALLLRNHQRRVVEAVANTHQLVQGARDLGVAKYFAEGFTMRGAPAKHAAQIEPPR